MKKLTLALVAALAFAQSSTHAAQRRLDPSVVAQVVISGGYVPGHPSRILVYNVKLSGDLELTEYFQVSGETRGPSVVGKLTAQESGILQSSAAEILPGELVDTDPSAPKGADGLNLEYNINRDGNALAVALRSGDLHTYALQQKEALLIKSILDKALAEVR
jgi:hypothetical protein